jgi:hypothetical protein
MSEEQADTDMQRTSPLAALEDAMLCDVAIAEGVAARHIQVRDVVMASWQMRSQRATHDNVCTAVVSSSRNAA